MSYREILTRFLDEIKDYYCECGDSLVNDERDSGEFADIFLEDKKDLLEADAEIARLETENSELKITVRLRDEDITMQASEIGKANQTIEHNQKISENLAKGYEIQQKRIAELEESILTSYQLLSDNAGRRGVVITVYEGLKRILDKREDWEEAAKRRRQTPEDTNAKEG